MPVDNRPKWDTFGSIAEHFAISGGKTLKEIQHLLNYQVSMTTLGRWSEQHRWQDRKAAGKLSPRRMVEKLSEVINAKIDDLDADSGPEKSDELIKLHKIFSDYADKMEDRFQYLLLDAVEDFFQFCQEELTPEELSVQRDLIDRFIVRKLETP